ncbi:hypothetical protein [Alteromonas gilva]|uniref:Uncharacterized protein n=1 Tax=Alteromonas gilva TaxID=2987522 RepID=A0ABT5L799_9ALTE|nr:hypothetical protein [Alteromonas gilva]MDC8832930.1 hypothetical protein [Alteromonas gilva]
MKKNTFVELKLNKQVIVREINVKRVQYKLKQLRVAHLYNHPMSKVCHVVTNMDLAVGNIFEASL